MKRKFSKEQLATFLSSEKDHSSGEIRDYLNTEEGKALLEEYFYSVWKQTSSTQLDPQKEQELYQKFLYKKDSLYIQPKVVAIGTKGLRSYMRYVVAAAVILALGFGLYQFYFYNSSKDLPNPTLAHSGLDSVVTGLGQRAEIKLADGSVAHLGPMSKLWYPQKFAKDERHIILEGQAYFDVSKSPDKPFRISSHNYITTVLGTTFLIDSYKADRYKLLVSSGKVQVERKNSANETQVLGILTKGLELVDQNGQSQTRNADLLKLEAWLHKDLVFNGERLQQIVEEINRNYDLEITIENKQLEELPITTIIKRGTNIDQFLTQSGEIFGFKFSKKGRQYSIYQPTN